MFAPLLGRLWPIRQRPAEAARQRGGTERGAQGVTLLTLLASHRTNGDRTASERVNQMAGRRMPNADRRRSKHRTPIQSPCRAARHPTAKCTIVTPPEAWLGTSPATA